MHSPLTLQDLEKLRILGEGTYGKCYLVHDKKNDELCVLKQIEIFGMSQEEQEDVIKEAKILSVLNHPSITKFLAFFKDQSYLNIVMEYADGGDLNKLIREAKGTFFSQNKILDWFTQLCLAVKHIHDRKVIHRDLKSQNIFTTRTGQLKLGDFGIAKHLNKTLDKVKTVVGTPYYMSPEICENKDYSFKTDIWSLGIILYEMCALKLPFDGNSLPVLALKISRGDYPPLPTLFSKQLRKLLSTLLQNNPNRRPTVNKILQNPLINKRIANFLPKLTMDRQFSHTTLHSKNIFEKENEMMLNEEEQQSQNLSGITKGKDESDKNIEVKSARNHPLPQKLAKTPQAKNVQAINSKLRQFGSNGKSGGRIEKKKKMESLKRREVSEPNLNVKKYSSKNEQPTNMKKPINPIEEQNQVYEQSIQETFKEILTNKFSHNVKGKLLEAFDHSGLIPEDSFSGSGLLALFWGFQQQELIE